MADITNTNSRENEQENQYDKFVSKTSKKRPANMFRTLKTLIDKCQVEPIILCGGIPHHSTFPIKNASFLLSNGHEVHINEKQLQDVLQYPPAHGYSPLLEHIQEMTVKLHNPPRWCERETMMTTGSQEGLGVVAEMLVEPGDSVIVTEYCYSTMLLVLKPLDPQFLAVPSDNEGIRTDILRNMLEKHDKSSKIKMMYLVPTGANPTGETMSLSRRREAYELACQYDFLIVEDDPYYHLTYDDEIALPSLLNLDTENRVIRLDSASKIACPGLRLGWVTAPLPLMTRLERHIHSFTIGPSPLSQATFYKVLKGLGDDGWEKHLQSIRQFYKSQLDCMLNCADKYLSGLAEWNRPTSGMYIWIKVKGISDTKEFVFQEAPQEGLFLAPGSPFTVDSDKPSPYIRVSFSTPSPDDIEKGFKIFGDLLMKHSTH